VGRRKVFTDAPLTLYRRRMNDAPIRPSMERLSISLPPVQMAWLRAEARSLGLTIGELLRRIIDKHRAPKELT